MQQAAQVLAVLLFPTNVSQEQPIAALSYFLRWPYFEQRVERSATMNRYLLPILLISVSILIDIVMLIGAY